MSMVIYEAYLKLHLSIYPNRLVPLAGIEPTILSLRMNCSTS